VIRGTVLVYRFPTNLMRCCNINKKLFVSSAMVPGDYFSTKLVRYDYE
jgi:hypothetical protein